MKKYIVLLFSALSWAASVATVALDCNNTPKYNANSNYNDGEIVLNKGFTFKCLVAGWCSQSAYAPLASDYWMVACEELQACENSLTQKQISGYAHKCLSAHKEMFGVLTIVDISILEKMVKVGF